MEEKRHSTSSAEIVCNQAKYNLEDGGVERDVILYCKDIGMTVVAHTPISKGSKSKRGGMKKISENTGRTRFRSLSTF